VFTSPLFPQATLKLANGKTLVVKANEPEKNIYIDKVWLRSDSLERNHGREEKSDPVLFRPGYNGFLYLKWYYPT